MTILEVVNETTGKAIEVDIDQTFAKPHALADAFTAELAITRAVENETRGDATSLKRAKMLRLYAKRKAEIDAKEG